MEHIILKEKQHSSFIYLLFFLSCPLGCPQKKYLLNCPADPELSGVGCCSRSAFWVLHQPPPSLLTSPGGRLSLPSSYSWHPDNTVLTTRRMHSAAEIDNWLKATLGVLMLVSQNALRQEVTALLRESESQKEGI